MKKFDFNHPDFMRKCLERQRFYKLKSRSPVTEEEFVAEVLSWPRDKRHAAQTRRPSASRSEYRMLVKNFGFFPGGQS